jgi:hypothetical protein
MHAILSLIARLVSVFLLIIALGPVINYPTSFSFLVIVVGLLIYHTTRPRILSCNYDTMQRANRARQPPAARSNPHIFCRLAPCKVARLRLIYRQARLISRRSQRVDAIYSTRLPQCSSLDGCLLERFYFARPRRRGQSLAVVLHTFAIYQCEPNKRVE